MKLFLRGLLLAVLVVFFACKEDDSLIGENFIENGLEVYFDTITAVTTHSVVYNDDGDEIVLSGPNYALIGDYSDDVFGNHKAMAVFDFAPESNEGDFGNNPVADSLILQLKVSGIYYGYDVTNPITVSVYQLSDTINKIDGEMLSSININDYYNETDLIGQTTHTPGGAETSLYIPLSDALAAEILSLRDTIEEDMNFIRNFNGVIIKAERQSGEGGSIVTFNTNTTDTHLKLVFHNDEESDQAFYYYTHESDTTSRYNFFEHDYSSGTINNFASSLNPTSFNENDSLVFLQSMRGINMKLTINMADSRIFNTEDDLIINKAYLALKPIQMRTPVWTVTDTIIFAPSSQLNIREIVDTGLVVIPDYSGTNYRWVNYDENDAVYNILFSALTHKKIKTSEEEYVIRLSAADPSTTANRAVFYGSGALREADRPRVVVVYSKRSNN